MARADTSPTAEAIQFAVQRRLGGAERLAIAIEMSLAARELALARIRMERPEASQAEIRRELLRLAFSPSKVPPGLP